MCAHARGRRVLFSVSAGIVAIFVFFLLLSFGLPAVASPVTDVMRQPLGAGEIINLLINGDFSSGVGPWWTTSSIDASVVSGELNAVITSGGSDPWDAIVGQHGVAVYQDQFYTLTLQARASQVITVDVLVQQEGGAYTRYLDADLPLTTDTLTYTYYFTSPVDNDAATFQFHVGAQDEFTVYLDNISLLGPKAMEVEEVLPVVRLNQTGFLPQAPKRATISNTATSPLNWTLYNGGTQAVFTGTTTVFGMNAASGEHVHIADFSTYTETGTDYMLEVDGEQSHPFDIDASIYEQLKYDALAYFYHNRSGIAITMPYASEIQWARPAGHLNVAPNQGDYNVTCFTGTDKLGQDWPGCDYTLDVTKGWYDAGDHGKYVVNGGISVWTMLNQYERSQHVGGADATAFADGTMNIPENANGVPDILDEARWEMEFMLSMQVTTTEGSTMLDGKVGLVHHKVHDEAWTGIGLAPHEDPQQRYLYPFSTAATLNLAATAAQSARIWHDIDPAFSDRCLEAAELAWDGAVANPDLYAADIFDGGGPYGDDDVSDEFYWAAAELYITTGDMKYYTPTIGSEHYMVVAANAIDSGAVTASAMDWFTTQALGTISLALVPNDLGNMAARNNVIKTADGYLAARDAEGYLLPYTTADDDYPWGSNSSVMNNMVILALAYDFSGDVDYLNAVSDGMDYLMGRNPMDKSYVSGYGERPLENPHHRFWAHQTDDSFPAVPPGVVSGGPNSGLEDPYAQTVFPDGCYAQRCYVDHIDSWSTNEITINWNGPFAWLVAFLDSNRDFEDTQRMIVFYLPVIIRRQ